jgi:hypothetical protein
MSGSTTKVIILLLITAAAVFVVALGWVSGKLAPIPYNSSSPVIYDNDETIDVYTDEYLMALSSLGEIKLLAFITSSSIKPFNQWVSDEDFNRFIKERNYGLMAAKESGFKNIPKHIIGTKGHLKRPKSDRIEDTIPIASKGSHFIVQEANKCSPEKPLVLIMGGPLTIAADAFLLDNQIGDKVIVAWLGGRFEDMGAYNGQVDPWATYIVMEKLSLILFPEKIGREMSPHIEKEQLSELSPSMLRDWMISKRHPNGMPKKRDADAPPAIFMMRPEYVVRSKHLQTAMRLGIHKIQRSQLQRVSFSHWIRGSYGHLMPAFKEDPQGNTIVIRYADKEIGTNEWWRAIKKSMGKM